MKKFLAGLIVGLIMATAALASAAPATTKLIVNGTEIRPDVPPQIINGRVMVPARFIAEPLGATVEWDAVGNAVIITSSSKHDVIQKNQVERMNNMTLKINGVDTGTDLWVAKDNDLYVAFRGIFEFIASKFNDSKSSFSVEGILTVNNKSYKIEKIVYNNTPLYSLNSLSNYNLLNYSWDSTTANLTLE